MKAINQVFTDDCTYCNRETLFVTHDPSRNVVYEELCKSFIITDDQFIELVCDGEVETKDKSGCTVKLEISDMTLV